MMCVVCVHEAGARSMRAATLLLVCVLNVSLATAAVPTWSSGSSLMIILLLFLQKQNLAYAVYQFGSVLSLPD